MIFRIGDAVEQVVSTIELTTNGYVSVPAGTRGIVIRIDQSPGVDTAYLVELYWYDEHSLEHMLCTIRTAAFLRSCQTQLEGIALPGYDIRTYDPY